MKNAFGALRFTGVGENWGPPLVPQRRKEARGSAVAVREEMVGRLDRQVTCLVWYVRVNVLVTVEGELEVVTVAPMSMVLVFTLRVLVVRSGVFSFVLIIMGITVRLTTTPTNLWASIFPPALTGVLRGTMVVVLVLRRCPVSMGLVPTQGSMAKFLSIRTLVVPSALTGLGTRHRVLGRTLSPT